MFHNISFAFSLVHMNFCFLAWPETAHNKTQITQVALARRLLFGKQVVSRTNICKGEGMQMGWRAISDHADENNTQRRLSNKTEGVWVPRTELSYQSWSTYFWTLALKKKRKKEISTLFNSFYFNPPLHKSAPLI